MRRLSLLLVVAACGSSTPDPHSPARRMTPKDIVQQSSDGIVRIESGSGQDEKVGTGFVLDKSGLVATNLHVVNGSSEIRIKLHDGTSHVVAEIAGLDPNRDLALLRIKPGKPLKTLQLGDSDAMTAGDQIIAIGNPLGVFDYTVSAGLVGAVRPLCTDGQKGCPAGGVTLLQITAPISQGSSGGPLFNQFGEVIGVTTAIIQGGQSINLAVPTNYLKPLVAQPIKMSMADFARETSTQAAPQPDEDGVVITRKVPDHQVAVLDGCSKQQVVDVVAAIDSAIKIGAPLYNQKTPEGMEACYRVYEGTATKLEQAPPCKGVGEAFGNGLLRAATMESYKEKAWAMRDTFDGLLRVADQRLRKP